MEIFQVVQKNLALMGYRRDMRSFNKIQLRNGLERFLFLPTNLLSICYMAKTVDEYMVLTFVTAVVSLILISFVSTVHKTETIFKFINELEISINRSK